MHGAFEQLAAGFAVAAVGEHARQRGDEQARPGQRLAVRIRVPAGDVQRLRAVGECVQGRSADSSAGSPSVSSGS